MRILESSEDYLEAMLMMKERYGYIRSIDIANELNVTKPSVSYATKRLRQNGYITMDDEGLITLTDAGMAIASRIYERHKTLTSFFVYLGVDEETAREFEHLPENVYLFFKGNLLYYIIRESHRHKKERCRV